MSEKGNHERKHATNMQFHITLRDEVNRATFGLSLLSVSAETAGAGEKQHRVKPKHKIKIYQVRHPIMVSKSLTPSWMTTVSRTSCKTISGTFTTLGDYTPLNSHRCPLFFYTQFCTSSKVFTRGPYSPLSLYTAEFAKVKSVQIQVHEGKQKLLLPPL